MPELTRILDKYTGKTINQLTWEEFNELMGAVAERGGHEALKKLGLSDDDAIRDIRDVRDLIKGYRVVKSTVWTQIVKVGVAALTLWFVILFFPKEKVRSIISLILG